jgi:hypothetical protein
MKKPLRIGKGFLFNTLQGCDLVMPRSILTF